MPPPGFPRPLQQNLQDAQHQRAAAARAFSSPQVSIDIVVPVWPSLSESDYAYLDLSLLEAFKPSICAVLLKTAHAVCEEYAMQQALLFFGACTAVHVRKPLAAVFLISDCMGQCG